MVYSTLPKLPAESIPSSLDPYSGPWTLDQVRHLLRRTTYGSTVDAINTASEYSMEELVDLLISDQPLPEEPINFNYEDDPFVAIGESWIDKPYVRGDAMLVGSRRRSLAGWTLRNLLNAGTNITEKMTLFWSNHFVTQASVLMDPNFIYYNNNLLRKNALGNFRTLVEETTVNPAMLRYLNGNQNSAGNPNENYARELFELFTIGKGELAGPGDYTTFTEQDVTEASKILTGWRDTGYYYSDGNPAGSRYLSFRHDKSTKQLSHRFDNAIISNQEENEYKTLIDIILAREEVSKYICRKLYRWFVYYEINDEVEKNVIEPLAAIFLENNYEIKPVLKALFTSDHFYNICSVGPMIKNPIDFIVNLLVQFDVKFPEDQLVAYQIWSRLVPLFEGFGMNYYEPPNVAGWKAYYQEPLFYRTWITAATLPLRQQYTNVVVSGLAQINDTPITMNTLEIVASLDNAQEPNQMIRELSALVFPIELTDAQYNFLKEALIPGLPDFEWTIEYNLYLNNPDDEEIRRSVDAKLRALIGTMLRLPEYYLS